jgi:hypothetical protein
VGDFDLKSTLDVVVSGLGVLLISLHAARHFGRFHSFTKSTEGGNLSERS